MSDTYYIKNMIAYSLFHSSVQSLISQKKYILYLTCFIWNYIYKNILVYENYEFYIQAMNDSLCHYAFCLLAFLFSGAEITHTLVWTYRNSRSIFAHSACKYNPEIVCAGENGTQKS